MGGDVTSFLSAGESAAERDLFCSSVKSFGSSTLSEILFSFYFFPSSWDLIPDTTSASELVPPEQRLDEFNSEAVSEPSPPYSESCPTLSSFSSVF